MTTEFLRLPGARREDDGVGGGVRSLSLSLSLLTTRIGTPAEFCRLRGGGSGLPVEDMAIDDGSLSLSRGVLCKDDPPAPEESSCRVELMVIGTAVGRRASKERGDPRPVSAECLSLFDSCCWPQPGLEGLLESSGLELSGLRPREDDEEGS